MTRILQSLVIWLSSCALLTTCLAAEPAQEEDPFDGPPAKAKESAWKNAADAREDARGIRSLASIPDSQVQIVQSPGESPYVAIGEDIYDVIQGKVIGKAPRDKIPNEFGWFGALSPNGKLLAYQHRDKSKVLQPKSIRVIDTQDQQQKHEFKSATDSSIEVLHLSFTQYNHLVVGEQISSDARFHIVNMETGKVMKSLFIEKENFQAARIAFNRSGQYMAAVVGSKLVVYDMTQGKPVAQMECPASELKTGIYTFVSALAFSPDSTELAALFSTGEYRLVIWNKTGQIVESHELGTTVAKTVKSLQWSPEGKAVLINDDYLLDRKLKAVAWICHAPAFHSFFAHRFLDGEHLLATRGDFQKGDLISVRIPRQGIDAAAAALGNGGKALLKPGDTVRLEMQVGQTYVSGASVSQELQKQIGERLALGGLLIGDGGGLTLQVNYQETLGKRLRVVEKPRLGQPGFATGQTVQDTLGVLEAKLVTKEGGKVLWENKSEFGTPTYIEAATVNDAVVREKMFEMITHSIRHTPFPYFLSADPKAPSLPIIVDLNK